MIQGHQALRRLRGVCLAALMTASAFGLLAPAASSAASISVNGVVTCASGDVQGVWIQSSKGGSKFASWQKMKTSARYASYSTSLITNVPTKLQLRVGCGGKPSKWGSTSYSPQSRSISGSATLNAFCDAKGKCNWPATGTKASGNLGIPKYCTWGAYDQWRKYTGYYPTITGNASAWPAKAKSHGWTVTSVPMPKGMVVMSTSGAGHVGWVNSVSVSSSGAVSLSITEMNYDGSASKATGRVRTKTYSANSAYRYIPAP